MERAFIMESTDTIQKASLPENLADGAIIKPDDTAAIAASNHYSTHSSAGSAAGSTGNFISDEDSLNYPALKERFEKEFIIRALKAYNGKINQTAEATQMTKVTLLRKLERFGIDPKEFYNI